MTPQDKLEQLKQSTKLSLDMGPVMVHRDEILQKNEQILALIARVQELESKLGNAVSLIERYREVVKEKDAAIGCIVFDEEIPTIGKSYWIDEYDLKAARKALALTQTLGEASDAKQTLEDGE